MDVYEPDGTRLFNIIKMKESALNEEELSREEFFSLLKESMTLAKIRGLNRDGRTPVRKLYPLFVLARQCRSEVFLSKPDAKNFRDYQTFHFVYDLARFGRDGWRCGDEILRTQTPNMATISKGETMMLPALDLAEGSGHQIAVLWIEKREET